MYDHKNIEKEIAKFWKKNKTYEKIKENNNKGEPFYFCDGPPYATGQIHPGTGWNKVIKDSVCRYRRAIGDNVRAQAGYDTHGLPIEVKVEKELGIKNKNEIEKLGIEKFIKECKKFATKYIGIMGEQFQSLGVWMDFNDPYITYKDDYINASWKTLKQAWELGLIHEGEYVLPYCYRCETTMANYELEYGEETDPSIFIKFKIKEKENEYLVIWTTTPWTLVANMGVMVHPKYTYVKVDVEGEILVMAKERMDHILNLLKKSGAVIEEISGKKLEGLEYEHPFQDKINKEYNRKVVLSDEYVTLEEGSGLVHTAPGHGPEDFIIGKRFGIEIFSPVDYHGRYTEEAGEFKGKNVREANIDIIKTLERNNTMLYEDRIKHRYPHCWRCKTPLIFLTTNQWFIKISELREKMVNEIKNVDWNPKFVMNRFSDFVSKAPDWCISRQRYWGIPLPIWKCEKCSSIKVVGDKKELGKVKELHRPYVDKIILKCECGEDMERIPDVLDVWFDSGNAIWASLRDNENKEFGERADIIIEGQDQIRGWFYSLLGSGMVRYGKSPYKKLLMHGFFVDEKGEKMSKSVGNFIPLEEIIEKYGADSFRLWSLSSTVWDELKFNWVELKEAHSDLMIFYNMQVFLKRFCPKKPTKPKKLNKEDEWLLSRLNNTLQEFHRGYTEYELNKALKAIRYFLVEDLSRWYMKIAKSRMNKNENKEAVLWNIYNSMLSVSKVLGIVCPFLAEHIYQEYFKNFEKKESLFLLGLESEGKEKINNGIEKKMETIKEICSNAFTVRQKSGIKTRWPIRTLFIESSSQEVAESVEDFGEVVKGFLNCKEVEIVNKKPKGKITEGEFSLGKIYVDGTIDEELYEEGMGNEVKRRIQNMRKELKLVEKDVIEVWIDGEDELMAIIKNRSKEIGDWVNAKKITIGKKEGEKEFTIDGRKLLLKIKKI